MTLIEALRKQAEDMRCMKYLHLYAERCEQAADKLAENVLLMRRAADCIAELEAELARRDEADGLRPLADIKDSIAAERGDQLRDKQVDNE